MKTLPSRRLRVRLTILSVIGFGLAGISCGDAVTDAAPDPGVGPDSVAVAFIEMLPAERALSFLGMSDRMAARRVAADGSFLGGSGTAGLFSWSSDAQDVVTVDSLGVVTAVRPGTARISATSAGVTGTATVTVREAVRLAWSFPFGEASTGALTIGDDGTIYAASVAALHAIAPGGTYRWSVQTGALVSSAPAIAPDGTLYVGTQGARGSLMAIDRSGAVRWTLENIGWIVSSPAIGLDGTIYAASRDSTLYALDPAGRKRWAFKGRGSFVRSSPALARDGTILVGAYDGLLYAVSPEGAERWTFQTGDTIRSSPAIAFDRTIYFTSTSQRLYALTPDGGLKWSLPLPLGDDALYSPAIGSDGTIYIGGEGLHAVDPNGRLRWTYPGTNPRSGTQSFQTPIVAGDGTVYVVGGAGRRRVFALAADGTLKWDHPAGGVGTPAIGLDGTILAMSDSTLHAIVERPGFNGGFAGAPWPKSRGDRANTGRVGGP
jgi:outer membrane protein assembly factor BamB